MVAIHFSEIDLAQVTLTKVSRTLMLMYNGEPLTFKSGPVKSPFGAKAFPNSYRDIDDYVFSVNTYDDAYDDFLKRLDATISKIRLQRDTSLDYRKAYKDNGEYRSLFTANLPTSATGTFTCAVYNCTGGQIDIDENNVTSVLGKVFCTYIVECAKYYEFKGTAGTKWTVKQIKLAAAPEPAAVPASAPTPTPVGLCLIDD